MQLCVPILNGFCEYKEQNADTSIVAMENVTADQSSSWPQVGQAIRKGLSIAGRAGLVGALTATVPGAALLLAPIWHRLRGDKDYFVKAATFPEPVIKEYGITPSNPKYGQLKRAIDAMLVQEGRPPAQLLVLDPIYSVMSGTYLRSNTIAAKEEFLDLLTPPEREAFMRHEIAHLVQKETRTKTIAQEFVDNAKSICLNFAPATMALAATAAKTVEAVTPDLFHRTADAITRLAPNLSVEGMAFNTVTNIVALGGASLVARFLARRAEFAADQYVVDDPTPGGVDRVTQALMRGHNLPDRARRAAVPMRAILTKPKLSLATISEALTEHRLMSTHPTVPERIRAAYAYANKKGIVPKLGVDDVWRPNNGLHL